MQGRSYSKRNLGSFSPRTRNLVIWLIVVGAIAAVGWWREQSTPALTGQARVIDGDSIWVGPTEVRLYGIDAVELHQTCTRAGQPWNCGSEAAQALRRAINGRAVNCRSKDRDRYGRTVATCSAGGLDLAAAMIKGGYAVAYGAYEADEREARDAGRGIWSSQFETPGVWRSRNPRRP